MLKTKTFDSRLFANSFQLVCNKFYYYEPLQHTQGSRANKIASSRFSNRSGKAYTGKSISIVVLLFVFFNLFVFFVVFLFFLETFTYHWHRYERRNIQSNLLRFVLFWFQLFWLLNRHHRHRTFSFFTYI